jgi:hypothetical protein
VCAKNSGMPVIFEERTMCKKQAARIVLLPGLPLLAALKFSAIHPLIHVH